MTGRWKAGVEEGETELPTEKEAVGIAREAMVRETTWKGVHGDAGSEQEEGREDIKGSRVQGEASVKELRGG